jgi:hypothetical protein
MPETHKKAQYQIAQSTTPGNISDPAFSFAALL